jgi:hypothetical protein
MIRWNTLLRRDVAEYSFLLVIVAAHLLVSFFILFHLDEFSVHKVAIAPHSFDKLLVRHVDGIRVVKVGVIPFFTT